MSPIGFIVATIQIIKLFPILNGNVTAWGRHPLDIASRTGGLLVPELTERNGQKYARVSSPGLVSIRACGQEVGVKVEAPEKQEGCMALFLTPG